MQSSLESGATDAVDWAEMMGGEGSLTPTRPARRLTRAYPQAPSPRRYLHRRRRRPARVLPVGGGHPGGARAGPAERTACCSQGTCTRTASRRCACGSEQRRAKSVSERPRMYTTATEGGGRTCLLRLEASVKHRAQCGHWNGLTSSCVRLWMASELASGNAFAQPS
jgi:hypothetical protein